MSVKFQNYHKNINKIMQALCSQILLQKDKILPQDVKYPLIKSFFCTDGGGEKLNVFVNWYLPVSLKESNVIVINMEKVSFSFDVQYKQKAKTTYNIDFFAQNNGGSNTIDEILFAAGIVREKLLCLGIDFFEGAKNIDIAKLEIYPDKTIGGDNNIISARLVFTIETMEVLTDIDDFDAANEMMSNLSVNNGQYSMYREW